MSTSNYTLKLPPEFRIREGYSDTEDSWVKEGDIDAEMVRVYFEGLEKEQGENKMHKVVPQPLRHHQKVWEGGVQGRNQSGNQ